MNYFAFHTIRKSKTAGRTVKGLKLLGMIVPVLVLVSYQQVAAFTQNDIDCIKNSNCQFDSTDCGPAGASATDTSTGDTANGPTIVLDPGHSGQDTSQTDPQTGLLDFDYPNNPEMGEVFQVAQKVQSHLKSDGYNVVMTKNNVNDTVSLRQRADIADNAHAALAVSIHDTHGTSWADMGSGDGGQVYVQKVGYYRQNKPGQGKGTQKVTFNDASVAQKSQQYGDIFAKQRTNDESHKVAIVEESFDGRSDLPSGNIPEVQLFAKVPWVYNEIGASNANLTSEQLDEYAQGIIDGVETSVPNSNAPVNSGPAAGGGGSCCASGAGGGTTPVSVSGSISPQVGKGLTANGQKNLQEAIVNGATKWHVQPNFLAAIYYEEHFQGGDSGGNNVTGREVGDGNWEEPPPPYGNGGPYPGSAVAFGPFAMEPGTWKSVKQDGNGDGKELLTDLYDAAMGAAKLLASFGAGGNTTDKNALVDAAASYNGGPGGKDLSGPQNYGENAYSIFFHLSNGFQTPITGSPTGGGGCSGDSGPPADQGSVDAAVQAAKQLSAMGIIYNYGGSHGPGLIGTTDPATLRSQGMACSSSTSWVLHQAGMFPSTTADDSTGLESWGKAGQGNEMTVWANAVHVWIEFNMPGLGHYEMNTVNDLGGPRFLKWGDSGSMTSTAGFTPRHYPGT